MKHYVDKYEENEIYLLKNGHYALIVSVAPQTERSNDATRTLFCYYGTAVDALPKDEQFKDKKALIFAPEMYTECLFDLSEQYKFNVKEFRDYEVSYIGKLNANGKDIIRKSM